MRQTEPPKADVRSAPPPALLEPNYPLTARQSLFWLDEYLYSHVPYHHVVLTLRLTGPLDVNRFVSAYRDTILSFDQFRLVFFEAGGEPRQAFRPHLEPSLPIIELAADGLQPFVEARSVQSFDFARGLFDGVLLRFGEQNHVFYFCQHHIISDGTSVGFFIADLQKRYAGEPVAPRPSYARYIEFENAYRKSKKCERDTRHFTQKLKGGTALRLYGRASDDLSIGVHRSVVDGGEERWRKLTELARDPRIELIDDSMSRLVAVATVLFAFMYRVSESRSLAIGTPIPNRTAEFLDTGGLIMEQTFLAVDIDDGETFASLAQKVRRELFSGLRHGQHCSSRGSIASYRSCPRLPPAWSSLTCAATRATALACTFSGSSAKSACAWASTFTAAPSTRACVSAPRATFSPCSTPWWAVSRLSSTACAWSRATSAGSCSPSGAAPSQVARLPTW
jgi:hypothetical protein